MLLRINVDSKFVNEDGYNDENDKIYVVFNFCNLKWV